MADACNMTPLVVIGAGPHALALVLTLLEQDSASEFTETEAAMLSFWRKKRLAPQRPSLRHHLRVLDPSGAWCANWNANFELFGISHLRSPLSVHLDPLRPEGLRDFATSTHSVVAPPPSTIRFNKRNKAFASQTSMFSENDRSFFGCPRQDLFAAHNKMLITQYKIETLVEPQTATSIVPVFTSDGDKTPSSFQVHCASGEIVCAAKVVVAVGTQRLPRRPTWSLASRRTFHSADLVAQGPSIVQARYAATRPHVLLVGGGLTSVHLAKQALRWGATHVTLLTRSPHLRVQPYDVPLEWLSPTLGDKMRAAFFAEANADARLARLKQARGRGSVTQAAMDQLTAVATPETFTHMGSTTVVAVEEVDGRLQITLSSEDVAASPLVVDEIILATGSDVDVTRDPLFRELLPLGVTTTGGFPNVDQDLRIATDVNVFLMGGYASLRLGPTAGNLMGGRAGANLLSDVLLDDLLPPTEQTTHHHVRCLCGKENMYDLLL
ncbi:hypothetical protein SDRG_04347, partial [Saprolegnia diclina VS20]